MIIKENQIKKFVNLIFLKMGLNKKDSALVSEQLINSDMSGHYSHGINRIFQYQNGVKKKIMAINKKPKITNHKNITMVDGQFCFGQIVMKYVCDKIIKNNQDINLISVENSAHVGRLSDYVDRLAKKDFVTLIFCSGGGPNVSPFSSKKRIVGTNPFAFGMPVSKKKNFIVDFSTSQVAEGKVNIALQKKQKLLSKAIIKKNGNLSNNPIDFYNNGSLMTFGGHKGSSFMLVNEILGGLLISKNNSFKNDYIDSNNCFLISFKKKLLNKKISTKNQFSKLENEIKNSRKVKNCKKIYLPGEIENINFRKSKKKGIHYDLNFIRKLNKFAETELKLEKKYLINENR